MGKDYISYLKANRSPSWLKNNLDKIQLSLNPLDRIYGHTAASSFGPKALKVVRDEMIAANLSRDFVNARVANIKRMIAWAVSEELLPASNHHALLAVEGLRRGTSSAKETQPVRPVDENDVLAVLPLVSPQIAAMIQIQWHTGMRPRQVALAGRLQYDVPIVTEYCRRDDSGAWVGDVLDPLVQHPLLVLVVDSFLAAQQLGFAEQTIPGQMEDGSGTKSPPQGLRPCARQLVRTRTLHGSSRRVQR